MLKTDFNHGWTVKHARTSEEGKPVTLPHDAMRTEPRSLQSKGQHNIGWFEGRDYEYNKKFMLPDDIPAGKLILEFEGVYHNAEVYLNGKKLAERAYGYTNFYVDITDDVYRDRENDLTVYAANSDQPNSRWYTGSGIYRPVWLWAAEEDYIIPNGVKVKTEAVGWNKGQPSAKLEISVLTSKLGIAQIEIIDPDGNTVLETVMKTGMEKDPLHIFPLVVSVNHAMLWNPDEPNLYRLRVTYGKDILEESFGIRKLTWNETDGLAINGKRIILRGACIHHDNGILGAVTDPAAEERRVRILKDNGYNAIRSAHNPASKDLLDACDKLGMLVMDEYVDMWYIHKTKYDYALHMTEEWPKDLKDMVDKDYNHPSVIMYSTGNEVAETGQERGIALTGEMTEYLHGLDDTRPVTCGVNIFFNALYSMGFGVYSDDKADEEADPGKKKTVGSEFYNTLAGTLGDTAMKIGATLPISDNKTKDAFANMDIAGYNYGILRYGIDLKKYPTRLILGSETFCRDAYKFYEMAKKEPRIIGDFVWAGMDYIGEAGIGSWEYEDYAPADADRSGWLTAGSGRIDIIGNPNGEALYTRVALEQEKGPYIAVKPVYQTGKHSPSAWKMTDATPSWTWPGCEGKKASVEVYARASVVKLYLNDEPIGTKRLMKDCVAKFEVPYKRGVLTAVSFDAYGNVIASKSLRTAGKKTVLGIKPEKKTVKPQELLFVKLRYCDEKGIRKPMEKHRVHINVTGAVLEGFGNACPYNPDGYDKDTTFTYYGEALAAVRAEEGAKEIVLTFTDENGSYCKRIAVK